MEKLEKDILKSVIKNLKNSQYHSWSAGYFADWRNWAYQMDSGIDNAINILQAMIIEDIKECFDVKNR